MVLMRINVYDVHYYPGSSVCGEVFIKVDKLQKCENIVRKLLGTAKVRWVKEEQIGNVRRRTMEQLTLTIKLWCGARRIIPLASCKPENIISHSNSNCLQTALPRLKAGSDR